MNAKGFNTPRLFQAQAFPSWQGDGAFGWGAQSEAALVACDRRSNADGFRSDGKAAIRASMLGPGGANLDCGWGGAGS